jgi:trigger factor
MTAAIETLSAIERRVALDVPLADVNREVESRLRRLQRTVRMSGFRPGKVPFGLVQRQYGYEVQMEVLNDKVGEAFNSVVSENKLRVAGMPKVEPINAEGEAAAEAAKFTATFEVYPEIKFGDFKSATVERVVCTVGDAEVDKTIDILRKQRATYAAVDRGIQTDDRITCNFTGTIDGVEFKGGQATDFSFVSGAKRMLPEFEAAALGLKAGESKTFDLAFPADYHGADVAGKTAQFKLDITKVEAPQLPPVDSEFAKTLGIADGDVTKMREEIRANLQREVAARTRNQTKESVMNAMLKVAEFEVPKALVGNETGRLAENARADLAARGMKVDSLPFPPDVFQAQAERRVRLGLILAELVKVNGLTAKQEQLRAKIEETAQSYENPAEVLQWYFKDKQRLADVEAVVLEDNVVEWALGQTTVVDKPVAFDELMGNAA